MRGIAIILALLADPVFAGSAVALRTLPAGTIIAEGDVGIDTQMQNGVQDLSEILGQQLRVMVYQGRRIDPSSLTAPSVVGRNQIVTLAYENAALRIEAEGRALSAGAVGQVIRVMNNSSRVTVSGRVASDGTVIVEQN